MGLSEFPSAMGAGNTKVPLIAGVDSLQEPGKKSIVSEPFGKFATAEAYFDAVLAWFRDEGTKSPIDGKPPQKLEFINEVEGKEFTVVSDWGKIPSAIKHMYSIPNVPKEGSYITKKRVVYDKASLSVMTEEFNGSKDDLKISMTVYTKIHKDPARVEFYSVVDGERKAEDPKFVKTLQQGLK